ncbi:MAG: hypothetical protein D6706_05960 [Chloroflexi bacterium]|nr:MAG: hypothetical protein D6706_05960 [Chloroflexota bacterium]
MIQIGVISQLQVQPESLKHGERPFRTYDPSGLCVVPALRLTPNGIIGLQDTWQEILDIHHTDHPRSRNRQINGISFMFTTQYDTLQKRFGPHATPGIAGENILVHSEYTLSLADLTHGVLIRTDEGDILLNNIAPIAPCAPFSRFMLSMSEDPPAWLMKETLQFLENGRRGFYGLVTETAVVRTGNPVFLPTNNKPD